MDLLLIARKVWRYKLVTLPIIALVILGAVMSSSVKEPLYEASSSLHPDQSAGPAHRRGHCPRPRPRPKNADNPYTRFADQSVVDRGAGHAP